MAAPISLKRRLRRKLPRVLKAARQWGQVAAAGSRPATRLVFVVGAQRSGTRLPLQVLDCASGISTYSEGADPYFNGVLLRPLDEIERRVRRSPAPIIALKPICETHRTIELLERFPASKAVWIFRNFEDTVNSASLKWTSGRTMLRRLVQGQLKPGDWRAGGLTQEKLQIARRVYRDDMSQHEANAVMWYLRNSLFFDLRCGDRDDVLLVRYEDLLESPAEHVTRLFDFIGVPLPRRALGAIVGGTRTRRPFPDISADIRRLCEDTHDRLLAQYRSEQLPVAAAAANHR